MKSFPFYKENDDGLNGIFLAAKYNNIEILKYLIKTYPDYIYNKNDKGEQFINYLNPQSIMKIIDLKLDWKRLLLQKISPTVNIFDLLLSECKYNDIIKILKIFKPDKYVLNPLIVNEMKSEQIIAILKLFNKSSYSERDDEDLNLLFPAISRNDTKLITFLLDNGIESNYFTMVNTFSPLMFSYFNNNLKITKLIWEHIKLTFDYNAVTKLLENIAHFILKNQYFDPLFRWMGSNCTAIDSSNHVSGSFLSNCQGIVFKIC
jgi:ankyrin repeat protein